MDGELSRVMMCVPLSNTVTNLVALSSQSHVGESVILIHSETAVASEANFDMTQLMSINTEGAMAVEIRNCIFRVRLCSNHPLTSASMLTHAICCCRKTLSSLVLLAISVAL